MCWICSILFGEGCSSRRGGRSSCGCGNNYATASSGGGCGSSSYRTSSDCGCGTYALAATDSQSQCGCTSCSDRCCSGFGRHGEGGVCCDEAYYCRQYALCCEKDGCRQCCYCEKCCCRHS